MPTRVALVTGGTRGIGAAISRALAERGCKVAAIYHSNEAAARAFADTCEGVSAYAWNVADHDACIEGAGRVARELGAADILVNNAGITRDGAFHKMTKDSWREVMAVNLDSLFNMTRPVFSAMRERGFGRIINISSVNGLKGQFGQVNYAASKAGMGGFTRALALEGAAKGVTVNAVAPGYIRTEMVEAVPEKIREAIIASIPLKRLGEAQEVAELVAWLAGDSAAFVTGATFSINGGQYMA